MRCGNVNLVEQIFVCSGLIVIKTNNVFDNFDYKRAEHVHLGYCNGGPDHYVIIKLRED